MAILGYDTVGSTEGGGGGFPRFCKFTATEDGSVTEMQVYVFSRFGASQLRTAIYSDNAGVPDALLAQSSETADQGSGGIWWPATISYSITASTTYWLAWWESQNGNLTWAFDGGGTNQYQKDSSTPPTYPNWDDPATTDGIPQDNKYSIYATYTPSGGGLGKLILKTPA